MKSKTFEVMVFIVPVFVLVFAVSLPAQQKPKPATASQQTAPKPKPPEGLTVDQVIQMVKAGVPEELIIAKIQKNAKAFDLSSDQLIQLKTEKVSTNIVKCLMDPQAQLTSPVPVTPPAPPSATAETIAPRVTPVPVQPKKEDSAAPLVPEQAGAYYLNGSELIKVDIKTLGSSKVAGRLGHHLTLGLKSVKINAYLIGPSAKTKVKETSPTFYVRLPEAFSIDEVVLVSLYVKTDRRELEVSAEKGAVGSKQGLRMEVMRPFESQELGPRLYKIATSILGKGEYLFYLVGSADTIKGIYGKGYDFSMQ